MRITIDSVLFYLMGGPGVHGVNGPVPNGPAKDDAFNFAAGSNEAMTLRCDRTAPAQRSTRRAPS
jgi:hypothetical protein